MVRHGLARVLIGVKALQTREKSANGFENLGQLLNTLPLCTTIVFVGRRSLKNEA